MSKLSLDVLKERAEEVASEDLLNTISGGIENACHDYTIVSPADPPSFGDMLLWLFLEW